MICYLLPEVSALTNRGEHAALGLFVCAAQGCARTVPIVSINHWGSTVLLELVCLFQFPVSICAPSCTTVTGFMSRINYHRDLPFFLMLFNLTKLQIS